MVILARVRATTLSSALLMMEKGNGVATGYIALLGITTVT